MYNLRVFQPANAVRFSIRRKMNTHKKWYKPSKGRDIGLRVYNCVAKRQVPVLLPNESYVTWYTCGPTVYDSAHIGHASSYVKLDLLQRILREHFKLNLVTAMNITDIDDKIIERSKLTRENWRSMTKHYEGEFWSDMKKLNVIEPKIKLRVSEHVPIITDFIAGILQKDLAYIGKQGSIYFDVHKYPIYGKLQKVILNERKAEPTQEEFQKMQPSEIPDKRAPEDFAMWKTPKASDEPCWQAFWGSGRPAWHVECSALASHVFGNSIDFHAGGLDLKFPHHENEEAQCCAFHNTTQWVNYWLHTGQLNNKGDSDKMSKSLNNTISITEMLDSFTADEFRMACAISNYKNAMEYSPQQMETARNALKKFNSFHLDCQAYLEGKKQGAYLDTDLIKQHLHYAAVQIDMSFRDDFDTSRAMRVLMDQIASISRCINATPTSDTKTASCYDAIAAVDNYVLENLRMLGFQCAEEQTKTIQRTEQEIDIYGLLEDILHSRKIIRERAVASKSQQLFDICDDLRNCLKQHGIEIRDHTAGTTWNFSGSKK